MKRIFTAVVAAILLAVVPAHEIKCDGYRTELIVDRDAAFSRNVRSWRRTDPPPPLVDVCLSG